MQIVLVLGIYEDWSTKMIPQDPPGLFAREDFYLADKSRREEREQLERCLEQFEDVNAGLASMMRRLSATRLAREDEENE